MKQVIVTFKTGRIVDWLGPLTEKDVVVETHLISITKSGQHFPYMHKDIKSVTVIDTEKPEEKPVMLYPKK